MKKRIKRRKKPTRRVKRIRRIKKIRRIVRKKKRTPKRTKRIARKKISRRKVVRRRRAKKTSKPRIYIGKGILEQLFESQPKVKLMKFFFRNADSIFLLKDILKKVRTGSGLKSEMKKLQKAGLLIEKKAWLAYPKKRGGVKKIKKTVYTINQNFDFFDELKNLILKSTISSKDELINDVRKIGNIKLLALSGVFKGNTETEADILVVGDKINQRKFSTFLKNLEAEVGKELKCALMTSKEFNYRYDMYDRFVRDLISENSDILINKLNLW